MVELNFEVYELTDEFEKIPDTSGVYMIQDKADKIIYVGMSKNIKRRLLNHKNKKWFDFGGYAAQVCRLPHAECAAAEQSLIKSFRPKKNKSYNSDWKVKAH